MRQIDNYTDKEIDALHLKGMLADNKAKPVLSAMLDASESFAPRTASERTYNDEERRAIAYQNEIARRLNKAQHSRQFGTSADGRPTLILGDHRSEAEKLRCAQIQIESDRQTITNIRSHADKLAEAIGKIRTAMDRSLDLTPSIYGAIATLKAYEAAE